MGIAAFLQERGLSAEWHQWAARDGHRQVNSLSSRVWQRTPDGPDLGGLRIREDNDDHCSVSNRAGRRARTHLEQISRGAHFLSKVCLSNKLQTGRVNAVSLSGRAFSITIVEDMAKMDSIDITVDLLSNHSVRVIGSLLDTSVVTSWTREGWPSCSTIEFVFA